MQMRILVVSTALSFLTGLSLQAQALPQAVETKREMVVTANPLATEAGARILRKGGTAADAMVAVQTVLGLVEPQSSGIGGGAFIVYYDAFSDETITLDAREKAPAAATEERFQNAGGFLNAWQSGLSVGVPGVPRMMEYMHDRYGFLSWRKLFRSAIKLAKNGFPLTERTSSQVAGLLARNAACDNRLFFRDPAAFAYFANPDCSAKSAGTIVTNIPYARTLRALRRHGADAFYTGDIAENIAAAVQGDLNIPGDMTVDDLANYDVVERDPVCIEYRGKNVCGMGPPSSGALAVGQILGILEHFDLSGDPLDVENVHLFTQAGRLAFADRGLYVGDSDFVTVPVEGMLDKDYLASRAALITNMDMGRASAGVPPGDFDPTGPDNRAKNSGTSHVSIVDRYGNALSMTTTIESSFGNGVMVNGFLLNNELTDFSFANIDSTTGLPIANRVQANKRPRSSMSPTIVFDKKGRVEIVTGSPGGSRIIAYTAQSIVNMLDFGLDPQEAINVPHYMNRNGTTDIETPILDVTLDYDAEALAAALKQRGHSDPNVPIEQRNVGIRSLTSGLSIIQIKRKPYHYYYFGHNDFDGEGNFHHLFYGGHYRTTFVGGADKRRDGTVGGR